MTLDVLHFIDNKGGNAEEIRESQRKRGLSVEVVDEVIQMYTDWVKCGLPITSTLLSLFCWQFLASVSYDASNLAKEVNAVQKEIAVKKKVLIGRVHRKIIPDVDIHRQKKMQTNWSQRRKKSTIKCWRSDKKPKNKSKECARKPRRSEILLERVCLCPWTR